MMKRLLIILLSMPCVLLNAMPIVPLLHYDNHNICVVQPGSAESAVSAHDLHEINKLIQRTPMQYLKIGDECRRVYGKYVSLQVTVGPFSGSNLQILLVKGKIFQRMRVCDTCPFSPWHFVQEYPLAAEKSGEFFVCSDGTIKVHNQKR